MTYLAHFVRTHTNTVWEDVGAPTLNTPGTPASGPFNGINVIVLTGTNLQYTSNVTMSAGAISGWVVNSSTQITITTLDLNPPGLNDVTVTTPSGSATAVGAFQFV